jgi:DNA-binding CsgD family transcriptional regulator
MPSVTHQALRKLSEALLELHEGASLARLPDAFLRALRLLISADIYTVDIIDIEKLEGRYVTWPPDIPGADTAVLNAHLHEHPSLKMITQPRIKPVAMWSDFTTLRQFRQKGLYHDFYRYSATNYQIALAFPVDEQATVCVVFNRRLRNFSEDDRSVLHILEPHLSQAYRDARARTEMEQAWSLRNLVGCEEAVLVATEDGELIFGTEAAMRLCQEWFDGGSAGALPPALKQWLAKCQNGAARMVRERDPFRLEIDCSASTPWVKPAVFLEESARRLMGRVVRLHRRRCAPSTEKLQSLGLTPREAEVLSWIAQGKRNSEIAVILGSQPRTVSKHVENVLSKLGVETRNAAAAMVWAME